MSQPSSKEWSNGDTLTKRPHRTEHSNHQGRMHDWAAASSVVNSEIPVLLTSLPSGKTTVARGRNDWMRKIPTEHLRAWIRWLDEQETPSKRDPMFRFFEAAMQGYDVNRAIKELRDFFDSDDDEVDE